MCLDEITKNKIYKNLWNHYYISSDGYIVNKNPRWKIKTFKKQFLTKAGYKCVTLWSPNGKAKTFSVHRLLAQVFIENPHNKKEVNHKNGIKTDNRVENLEWVTRSENQKHYVEFNNVSLKGDCHPQSKLSEKDVLKIRKLRSKFTHRKLAQMYNVSSGCIYGILSGKTWSHI